MYTLSMETDNFYTPGQVRKIFNIKRPTFHVWEKNGLFKPDQKSMEIGRKSLYSFENVMEVGFVQKLLKRKWGAVGDKDYFGIKEIIKGLHKFYPKIREIIFSKQFYKSGRYKKRFVYLYFFLKFTEDSRGTESISDYHIGFYMTQKEDPTFKMEEWNDIRIVPLNKMLFSVYKKIERSVT